jgi:pyruvate formate lyase activating enzyme
VKARRATDRVPVAGLTRLTTIDFPGRLAAVVYLQGCPWRCGYCHNSDLQPRGPATLVWDEVLSWLGTRKGLVDGVVFSGGEPTLHAGLGDAIEAVRALGFDIGLHTAGIYPQRFERILPLLDWVGFDIKACYRHYDTITGVTGSADRAWQSAQLLLDSSVAHEFRTTLHPDQMDSAALGELVDELLHAGARHYAIQHCVISRCADEQLRYHNDSRLSNATLNDLGSRFDRFEIRDAA